MTPAIGAEIRAAPAEDMGAAQHHGGNRGQQIGVAHALRGLGGIAGQKHAAKRAEAARHSKGQHDDAPGVDA